MAEHHHLPDWFCVACGWRIFGSKRLSACPKCGTMRMDGGAGGSLDNNNYTNSNNTVAVAMAFQQPQPVSIAMMHSPVQQQQQQQQQAAIPYRGGGVIAGRGAGGGGGGGPRGGGGGLPYRVMRGGGRGGRGFGAPDWLCETCNFIVYGSKMHCQCGAPNPSVPGIERIDTGWKPPAKEGWVGDYRCGCGELCYGSRAKSGQGCRRCGVVRPGFELNNNSNNNTGAAGAAVSGVSSPRQAQQ